MKCLRSLPTSARRPQGSRHHEHPRHRRSGRADRAAAEGAVPPKIEHSAEDLKNLVYTKMHRIYGETCRRYVQDRVDIELLNTILDHSYDVIYMSAQKLVQNSLENGYLVGSRGSVGSRSSLICPASRRSTPAAALCLPQGATASSLPTAATGCGALICREGLPRVWHAHAATASISSVRDLPLASPATKKTPDIDLNFSGEYQAKAHKYTEVLFGSDHVFRAGTIGTPRRRPPTATSRNT